MVTEEETTISSPKPICVVLDANIWIGSLFLRSSMGSALLHMLQRVQGYIGLPEIIEEEVKKHIIRFGLDEVQKINNSLEKVQILTGKKIRCSLPSKNEFEASATSWFEELDELFSRIPFTTQHAKSALVRVNSELPPNAAKNQQFKDSAIWEAILDLSKTHTVHFVTKDNGFFKGRDAARALGLAPNLLGECESQGFIVHLYSELGSCVEYFVKTAPPLNLEALTRAIDAEMRTQVEEDTAKKGFEVGSIITSTVSVFPTQHIGISALKFEIIYELFDAVTSPADMRIDASLSVEGDCSYDDKKESASNVQFELMEYRWQDANGEIHKPRNLYLRVHDTLHVTATIGGGETNFK